MAGNTPPIRRLKGDCDYQICTSMMGWQLRHPFHGIESVSSMKSPCIPLTFSTSEDGGHATLGRTCAEPRPQQMTVTWAPPWDWCSNIYGFNKSHNCYRFEHNFWLWLKWDASNIFNKYTCIHICNETSTVSCRRSL